MALGQKRICYSCGAKFYDLEKEPAICPKCETENYLDGDPKTKRGRKQLVENVDEDKLDDIEIEIDGMDDLEEIDEDDDDVTVDLDSDIRSKMTIKDDEEAARERAATKGVFDDVEGDSDDIIDSNNADDDDDSK